MSKTPRTDALERTLETTDAYILIKWAEHARAIELENDQLKAEVELFKSQLAKSNRDCLGARAEARDSTATDNSIKLLEKLKTTAEEVVQLRAEVDRLRREAAIPRPDNNWIHAERQRDQWRAVADQLAAFAATCHRNHKDQSDLGCVLRIQDARYAPLAAYEKLKRQP